MSNLIRLSKSFEYILSSSIFYLFLGNLTLIGVGLIINQSYFSFLCLVLGLVSFSLGWFISQVMGFKIRTGLMLEYVNHRGYKQVMFLIMLIITFLFVYIYLNYGIPMLAEDKTISRLKQRSYPLILLSIQYLIPLLLFFGYIFTVNNKSKLMFYVALLFCAGASFLLAIRYVFSESILLLIIYILQNQSESIKKRIFKLSIYVTLFAVFFAMVQQFRIDESSGISLSERLVNRLFFVNSDIFELSFKDWHFSHVTYINSILRGIGEGGYNIGFELYDRLGYEQRVQGYAPPSLIGEAIINFNNSAISYLLLIIVGILYGIYTYTLSRLLPEQVKTIFYSFVCLEMFRLYAHTLVGSLMAIAIFYLFLRVFFVRKRRYLCAQVISY